MVKRGTNFFTTRFGEKYSRLGKPSDWSVTYGRLFSINIVPKNFLSPSIFNYYVFFYLMQLSPYKLRSSQTSVTNSESPTIRNYFPLPRLDLPTFADGYEELLGFRDLFSAIIPNDQSIPKV